MTKKSSLRRCLVPKLRVVKCWIKSLAKNDITLPRNSWIQFTATNLSISFKWATLKLLELHRSAQSCTELHRVAQSCTELHRVAQSCTELHRDAKRCKDLAEQFLYRYNLFYIMRWNGVKFFWDCIMIIIIAFIFLKWAFTE